MSSRVQLALNVNDIEQAVAFYRKLFGAEPAKRRPGYANFAIADPPLNLALLASPGQGGPACRGPGPPARVRLPGPACAGPPARVRLPGPGPTGPADGPAARTAGSAFRHGEQRGHTLQCGGHEPVVDPGAAPLAGDDP